MKRRSIFIVIFLIVIAFTLYEEFYLRSYLFRNHIKPEFIAGSLPNFIASLIFCFGLAIVKLPTQSKDVLKIVIAVVAGLTLYEFAQLFMPSMVFDVKDIAASVIGGLLAYFVIIWVNKSATAG